MEDWVLLLCLPSQGHGVPLQRHAAPPPGRFCSVGSQRPATPGLGCWGMSCRSPVTLVPQGQYQTQNLGLSVQNHLRGCHYCLGLRTVKTRHVLLQAIAEFCLVRGTDRQAPSMEPCGQGQVSGPSSSALFLLFSPSFTSPAPCPLPLSSFFLPSYSCSSQACTGRAPRTFCTLCLKGNRRPESMPQTLRMQSESVQIPRKF